MCDQGREEVKHSHSEYFHKILAICGKPKPNLTNPNKRFYIILFPLP